MDAFTKEYLDLDVPFKLLKCTFTDISEMDGSEDTKADVIVVYNGEQRVLEGIGNGPIDSFKKL